MPNLSTVYVTVIGVSTVCLLMFRWLSRRCTICVCSSKVSRHAVITGATSGIGRATAFELAKRNWRLTLGCRDLCAAKLVAETIANETGNVQIDVKQLDLIDQSSIASFAESFADGEVDVLINNAGVMAFNPRPVTNFDGLNVDTVVNYLGPFYLTHLMIPKLKAVDTYSHYPRLVFVSSALSKRGCIDDLLKPTTHHASWNHSQAYADSKLAVCLFARELHRRFGTGDKKKFSVYCLFTGGMVNTNLGREIISSYPILMQPFLRLISRLLFHSPQTGCQSVVHCTLSDAVPTAHVTSFTDCMDPSGSGLLYSNCVPIDWPTNMKDFNREQTLWKQTMQFLKLKDS